MFYYFLGEVFMRRYITIWKRAFFIVLLTGLLVTPGVIHANGPDVEMFAAKGLYRWLEKSPYLKKIAETPLWQDVKLSGQAVHLMSLNNRLEKQLGTDISKNIIREFLSAPMEVSLWNAFDEDEPLIFTVTLDVKPQLKGLVQVAELYGKSAKKTKVIQRDGRDILETRWAGRTFYHLVHKNQLILSNSLDHLPAAGSFRQSQFYTDFHKNKPGGLKLRISLGAWLKNVIRSLGKESMDLAIDMDLDEKVEIHSFSIIATPGFETETNNSMQACSAWIPRRAALAVAGVYPAKFFLMQIKELDIFPILNVELKLDIEKEVMPYFGERFFFYIETLGDASTNNILNGAAGLELNGMNDKQKSRLLDFLRLVMTRKKQSMVEEEYPDGLTIYRYKDERQPAFCITPQWLLLATGYRQLTTTLDINAKKRTNISDSLDFRTIEKELSTDSYWQILFHPPRFFKSAAKHFRYRAQSATLYNPVDVEKKILPVLNILGTIPSFAIFTGIDNKMLRGEVRFIEQQ